MKRWTLAALLAAFVLPYPTTVLSQPSVLEAYSAYPTCSAKNAKDNGAIQEEEKSIELTVWKRSAILQLKLDCLSDEIAMPDYAGGFIIVYTSSRFPYYFTFPLGSGRLTSTWGGDGNPVYVVPARRFRMRGDGPVLIIITPVNGIGI